MSRMLGAVTPRLRFALATLVGSAVAVLLPVLVTPTVDASPSMVLAALVIACAAAATLNSHVATSVARVAAPSLRSAYGAPVLLAGRVTDPVHHPIRPRAPGMA
jgi:hypothetical protein